MSDLQGAAYYYNNRMGYVDEKVHVVTVDVIYDLESSTVLVPSASSSSTREREYITAVLLGTNLRSRKQSYEHKSA